MEKNENKMLSEDDKLTIDDRITIKELEDKIASMKADKEKKCKLAKDQLIEMLEVTVDKYRTATGTAEALRVMRFAYPDAPIACACKLAHQMAETTKMMLDKAKKLNYAEMDQICDGFYDKDFHVYENVTEFKSAEELAYEMMCIDLCRNVGGAAEDMVEFIRRVEADIDDTGKQLKELKTKEA